MPALRVTDWRYTVGLVSGGHFLSHFYILSLPPLFPLLQAEFGLSTTELGLLVSIVFAATTLQAFVGGVVDRIGAKRVFVGGLALTAAGIAVAGFATSYPMLVGLVLLSGIGQSTFHPADYALIDAAADPEYTGKSFSVHSFDGFSGFAAAPVVVGTVGLAYDWGAALLVVGAFGLLYAAVAGLTLDTVYLNYFESRAANEVEDGSDGGSVVDVVADLLKPSILLLLLFFVVFTIAGTGVQTFIPILATTPTASTRPPGTRRSPPFPPSLPRGCCSAASSRIGTAPPRSLLRSRQGRPSRSGSA